MKLLKKIVSIITVISMMIGMFTFHSPVNAVNSDTLISEMIMYYQTYQDEANTDIQRLLSELEKVDEKEAEAWEDIMAYWSLVNTEGYCNIGSVPSGLPNDNSVAVVILGFALNSDGTMKDELIGRLQTGLDIANAYPNSYVVVTGGGTAANNPNVTEGGLMGEWLLEQGLSSNRLIVENRAPDTVGNAKNTYAILNEQYPQVDSIVLVTSDYHVPRGCLLYNSKFILEALENNSERLEIISNAGFNTGTNGYETIALQANGLRSVAGISAKPTVELSSVIALNVKLNKEYVTGNELDLTVEALYNTGYQKDVTDLVTITNFDKNSDANQTITLTYEENGVSVTGEFTLNQSEKDIIDTNSLEALINEAKNVNESKYTKNSLTFLKQVVTSSEAFLEEEFTLEEYKEAVNKLKTAIEILRLRVNLIKYVRTVKTNATSVKSGGLAAVYDGSTSTYAEFREPGIADIEIVFELDGYYDLDEIVVRPYHKDSDAKERSYFYDVYVSEDNVNWELVASHTTKGTKNEGNSHLVDTDVAAKYIKIDGTGKINPGTQSNQYFHLSEVYAYGDELYDIVINKPYTSSGADTSVSSSSTATTNKAIDGDRSTYWDAGAYANKPWIDIDLENVYELSKVNVINYVNTSRYYEFEVYASTDGVNYAKVGEKKNSDYSSIYGADINFEDDVFARHLRVVGTYNSKNSAFHIAELRAYGQLATQEDLVKIAKQELKALVSNIFRSDYTQDSWALYLPVRTKALALVDDVNASIPQIDAMKEEVRNAVALLERGNPDNKEEGTFRIASFNIWAPNPNHPDVEAIFDELLRCEVDYAGMQEIDKNNTRDNRDVLALIAGDYFNYEFKKAINYKNGEYGIGQLSTTDILEVTNGNYKVINGEEGRAWQRMLVEVDGKLVAIYNTHLSADNTHGANDANVLEFLEVLEKETCKYVVVTGDFNASREAMDPFKEKYDLVNGNDGLWYSTFTGDKYSDGVGYLDGTPNADITSGIDNIIVSRNIEYSDLRVVYNEGLSDHFMIYADLKLLAYEDDLKALVDSLKYDERFYTLESWQVYAKELEEAKVLLESTDYASLQDEYKQAIEELTAAVEGLELNLVDKTDLIHLVELVTSDVENEELYKPSTYVPYVEALEHANNVLANDQLIAGIDDAIVEEAFVNLMEAWSNLRKVVDKTMLKDLLEEAGLIDMSTITKESADRLVKALTKALEVMENKEASEEEVAVAGASLKAALDVEYLKTTPTTTGDSNNFEIYAIVGVISLIAAIFLLRKKKD